MSRQTRSPSREALADRLHSAAIHLLRNVRGVDAKSGVTPSRLSALSVVVYAGPLTLGELAAAEQVTAPTMTRLVAGMERDGLVRRLPHASDRRAVQVAATARGRRILDRARQRRLDALSALLRDATPDEVRVLARAVATIERLVGAGAAAT